MAKTKDKKEKAKKKTGKGGIKAVDMAMPSQESERVKEQEKKQKAPKIRGRKHKAAKAKIDRNKLYEVPEAIALIKQTSYSKFDGTVELHAVVKKEGITANVTLPYSAGKQKKVEVADEGTLAKLKTGKVDFDVLLATAEMMPKLVAYARILGPRGLMPNPKNGTLIKTAGDAKKFSGNTMSVKTEKGAPLIHTAVGKVSQDESELSKNIKTVIAALGKGQVIKAYLSPTMGPSVKIAVS